MTSTAKEARAAITMAEDATFDDAAAEKARVDAEARRQRILEKSRERMGVVSGEKPAGEPDDQEAPFGESRMQAMRRRRFKKSAPAKEEGDKKGDTSDVKPVEPAETSAEAAASSDAPAEESEVAKPATTTKTETSKKKYKGVAKMRREALKKDKKEPEVDSSTSAVVTVSLICKPPVYRLPIVLHLFAVLLLFLAGLDIGWNQVVLSDVMIHRQLAPMEHGAGLLNRIKAFSSKSVVEDPSKLLDTGMDGWPETTQEEFVSPGEEEEEYIPNIDPLFQIDLDLVTKGDGILNVLARGAVNIHRLILRVFYYLPLSMLRTMIAIPQQLVATPPVLCIVSLVVRQAAKLVFGANLPDPASKKGTKDVFGKIRQSVATFLSSSFPTAVSLYDIWTHLRSDMYVILCGVFVGLAYTHHIGSDESYGISDEL